MNGAVSCTVLPIHPLTIIRLCDLQLASSQCEGGPSVHHCITFALWQEDPFWPERVRVSTQSSSYRLWSLGTLGRLWTQRHGAAKVRISDNTSCVRTHTGDKLSCAFGHAPIWLCGCGCVGVSAYECHASADYPPLDFGCGYA